MDHILNKCYLGCEEYDITKDEEWNNIDKLSKNKGLIKGQSFPFINTSQTVPPFSITPVHKGVTLTCPHVIYRNKEAF